MNTFYIKTLDAAYIKLDKLLAVDLYRTLFGVKEVSDITGHTLGHVTREANDLGLIAITPHPCELMLDIDEPFESACAKWSPSHNSVMMALHKNGIPCWDRFFTMSKSGNTHLYIRFHNAFTDLERVALQAALGSDPVREALSVLRHQRQPKQVVSCLFETEEWATRLLQWREGLEKPDWDGREMSIYREGQ